MRASSHHRLAAEPRRLCRPSPRSRSNVTSCRDGLHGLPGVTDRCSLRRFAMMVFANRSGAGRLLADRLSAYAHRDDVLVLALPRGGVPVAYEIAEHLGVPLDVF